MWTRSLVLALLASASVPGLALAQHEHKGGAMAAVKPLYERIRDLYVKSAEIMPEADYAFKPTEKVRSYGQLLGHIANEHYIFCSAALGEKDPNTTDYEKVTSKAEMIAAIKKANVYCDAAYAISEAKAMEPVTLYDTTNNKLWALTFNVVHDSEHYGNIVTYLRLKGLVPPSSQGGV
jgi:uncharacterized damage-inducible protein DinB